MSPITPHAGYHWDGWSRPFFEGWYYRVTLPERMASFAFMYAINQPGGGVVQVYGPHESYFCRSLPQSGFWAWNHCLGLGHSRRNDIGKFVDPDTFFHQAHQAYQATDTLNQGILRHPDGSVAVRWCYEIKPIYTWGKNQATGGWLSYLPLYDPGWQVLLAHGQATGWIEWQGTRYDFNQAPAYSEKNWGRSFPGKWFWLQANAFEHQPNLTLTAAGGMRQLLAWAEPASLIGIHYQGEFYEFAPWSEATTTWDIHPWGQWSMSAATATQRVEINAYCHRSPTAIRVPTTRGFEFACLDTLHGCLSLALYQGEKLIVTAKTNQAGLEIGGGPWLSPWVQEYPLNPGEFNLVAGRAGG